MKYFEEIYQEIKKRYIGKENIANMEELKCKILVTSIIIVLCTVAKEKHQELCLKLESPETNPEIITEGYHRVVARLKNKEYAGTKELPEALIVEAAKTISLGCFQKEKLSLEDAFMSGYLIALIQDKDKSAKTFITLMEALKALIIFVESKISQPKDVCYEGKHFASTIGKA